MKNFNLSNLVLKIPAKKFPSATVALCVFFPLICLSSRVDLTKAVVPQHAGAVSSSSDRVCRLTLP